MNHPLQPIQFSTERIERIHKKLETGSIRVIRRLFQKFDYRFIHLKLKKRYGALTDEESDEYKLIRDMLFRAILPRYKYKKIQKPIK